MKKKVRIDTVSNTGLNNFKNKKIGYIVATCSPVTKAHIELALQSINELNLDYLFFIIWPFYYIKGFHSSNLNDWIKKEKHYNWETRIKLLETTLYELNNQKIKILYEAKEWYIESETNFNPLEQHSYFWTGTWYVIRKLQAYFNSLISDINYYFISGSDQFNPNIYALFDSGKEKVWKDYCIAEQLALHNYYVVDRGGVEYFIPPKWIKNKIIFGEKLKYFYISATKVRLGDKFKQKENCYDLTYKAIQENKLW